MAAFHTFQLGVTLHTSDLYTAFELFWPRLQRLIGPIEEFDWEADPSVPFAERYKLQSVVATADAPIDMSLEVGSKRLITLHVHGRGEEGGRRWYGKVQLRGQPPPNVSTPWRPIRILAQLTRELLQDGVVISGRCIVQQDPRCLPSVPIVEKNDPVVITTEAEVAEHFERPEVFWRGWSSVEKFGDLRLLVRAEDATTSTELLRAVQDQQWDMLRATKPGQQKNPMVTPAEPEDAAVFEAGSPRLEAVGYLPETKTVEMSYARPAGEHIRGWEIQRLIAILDDEALPDGRPVEVVRVVFMDEAAAQIEKRALLEYGIKVFYMNDRAEAVPLER